MREFTVSVLPNGLIRLWDDRCKWAVFYRPDGEFHSGSIDHPKYREAIANHFGHFGPWPRI